MYKSFHTIHSNVASEAMLLKARLCVYAIDTGYVPWTDFLSDVSSAANHIIETDRCLIDNYKKTM